MDTQLKRYARKLVEEQLGQSRLQLAQIADDISFIKTQQEDKFSNPDGFAAKPFLTRFKILICGVHPADVDPRSLPWAYPQFTTSGLRGESLGIPVLPRGTFVYVSRDMQTGEYFIERIAPNMTPDLPLVSGSPYGAVSGLDATNTAYPAPDTVVGNSLVLGNEIFNVNFPSLADQLQNSPREDAKWQFPTLDGAKNTVGGMSSAIENSIKDVERLKRGLIGGDSILRQSLETLQNAEKSVEAISEALGKQVKLISGYINTIMKKAQKKMLRQINQVMNKITAAGPLSGKFANNQLINKAIKVASCAFNLAISEMPNMVGQGLMGIVNKAVNTSSCLIENFVSNFVGQITGQLSALVEGALGTIDNVLGGSTDVLGSIGDVLGSIMNLLNCEVTPKAGDPVVKEWNFLDGGSPVKITLNTDNIFEKAKKVGETFKEATKVPSNISQYKYKFDPSQIAEQTMSECGDMGPDQCGPPNITFWGGEGSGAKGNPVVSTAAGNFGQLMGVDIIQSGSYTKAPYVHVDDACGGGRGAVLQALLGAVETPAGGNSDFTGNVKTGDNKILGFDFLPLASVTNKSELIGMEIVQLSNSPSLPEGTIIQDVKGDALILSNKFVDIDDGNSMSGVEFGIVGYGLATETASAVGIATFDVSVKNAPGPEDTLVSKFLVDNRQQRTVILERGKTYQFDQSSPSNGLVLKVGTDEFSLIQGEETYDIDTKWYDDINIHPFRFSEKSDGIHNCDRSTVTENPDEWLLSKDGLPSDAWVLTNPEQGWSVFLQNYGRYPAYSVLPGVHEGNWEVDIKEPGTYTFEMQADNRGTITFDGIFIGSTDPIPSIEIPSTVLTESTNSNHVITYNGLQRPGDLLRVTDRYIEFDDDSHKKGFDKNASFTITGGDATFSDDGRTITGTGPIKLKYEWRDKISISGKALESITIGDITWTQTDEERGSSEQTVNLEDTVTTTETIVYEQGLDLARGPHRNSKFLEVEVFELGKHTITATVENTRRSDMGATSETNDWNKNPGALGWVLRNTSGQIVRTSNDPFITTTEQLVTNCGVEYVDGVTKVGEPGKPGAYVQIVVGDNTPEQLYYYCENHPKMGGAINVIGGETGLNLSCRNATVVVDDVNDKGSVIALRDLKGGTGYREGSTNLLTEGGNGTSLTLNITRSTDEGSITALTVNNGGMGYLPGDIITPLCNFGDKIKPKTGIGVTAVIIKETGWGYKPWKNGDWGGMGRTWADRCQTIVHRANGDWDIPYTHGQVATLYLGDCIRFPAQDEICIEEDFTESMIPGSQIIDEKVLPKDMTDIQWGGSIDGTGTGIDLDFATRAYENAIPDKNNPYFERNVTYVERIDGTDPEYPAGVAQWWFYWKGEYKGTYIQDTLSQIPQLVQPREGLPTQIMRVAGYKEKVQTEVTIDLEEWLHVASELRNNPETQEAWVINDAGGWSPFLQCYGVFPSVTDDLSGVPQVGTWSVLIPESGAYHFEVQADNQGSITFDGTFLGSTTVFRSHNDSTFFEVNIEVDVDSEGNPIPTTKNIQGTILNANVGKKKFKNNPAALAWVMRKGDAPDRQLVMETSTVLRESRNRDHSIVYTGLKQPTDVRWATKTLLEFDDDSGSKPSDFDINAKLEILSGDAEFIANEDRTCNTIRGTGEITLKYSWTDNPRISGQVLDFLTIEDKVWDQGDSYSGFVTETVTLTDVVTTEEVEVRTESYVTVGADGEIIASSLDPFKNELETIESDTKTIFGINLFTSEEVGVGGTLPPVFNCDRDYVYAKSLGFSDCDIRNYIEESGILVDQCMQDKLDDDEWGRCANFRVLVTAPDCPEKGGECPPGYYFDNGVCRPDPCPPGEHWDAQQQMCVPDDCPVGYVWDSQQNKCVPIDDECPPGYMKDPAGSGKCIPIVPTTCPPSDTYRVIACLEAIIVANPGFGYNCCEDTVVIEPANGAEAIIEECDGGILKVKVTKCGAGFKELPEVYINTKNGLNAFLIPVLKFHRENFNEFPEGTSVVQVIDCVGNTGPNARTRVT